MYWVANFFPPQAGKIGGVLLAFRQWKMFRSPCVLPDVQRRTKLGELIGWPVKELRRCSLFPGSSEGNGPNRGNMHYTKQSGVRW